MSGWYRVGGGLERSAGGGFDRAGPADREHPPERGLRPLLQAGVLVGWADDSDLWTAEVARAAGQLRLRERREHLVERLDHKVRGGLLALEAAVASAAGGSMTLMEQAYDLAREVRSRAEALSAVVVEPREPPRALVLRAAIGLAGGADADGVPVEAVVNGSEQVLRETTARVRDWMGGEDVAFAAVRDGGWWRVDVRRSGPPVSDAPELREMLVRHLVDVRLSGWLAPPDGERVSFFLPAADGLS